MEIKTIILSLSCQIFRGKYFSSCVPMLFLCRKQRRWDFYENHSCPMLVPLFNTVGTEAMRNMLYNTIYMYMLHTYGLCFLCFSMVYEQFYFIDYSMNRVIIFIELYFQVQISLNYDC